jgi:hypothetical protein
MAAGRSHSVSGPELTGVQTMMISALEIGFGLSATLMALVFALSLPRPKRVRVRARRDSGPRG